MKRLKKVYMLPIHRERRLVLGLMLGVLAILAITVCIAHPAAGVCCLAGLGMLGTVGVGTDEEFEKKVLSGVEELGRGQKSLREELTQQKSRFEQVASDLGRSDKEVKQALEDLTRVKNTMNDFDASMKAMQKVQRAIALNARSSWRDPVEKALAENEELGAFINASARAACFPDQYNKLPGEWRKLLEEAASKHKALTGVDSSLGQATIPSEWFKSIYDTLLEYGDWATLDVIQVGARTNLVPVATARPAFYWIGSGTGGAGESTAITEGAFTGSSVTLTIQTLAVYLTAARELLADASVDMAPYLMKQLLQSVAFGMDTAAFISTGAADQTNAGYYGIFQAGAVNTNLAATAAAGDTTVEATTLEDWQNVLLTVSPQVLKRKACWWMQPQILIRALGIRDKNGRPLFQTYTEAPTPGGIGNILGYPVKLPAVAPTTNAAGNPVAAFGDPAGQAVGIRQDMEFATSDDIKFAENMRAFRCLCRCGVKLKTLAANTTLKPIAVLTLAAQ